MKQKDIAIIIVVAGVAAIISFVLANYLFGGKNSANLKSPTVDVISAEFILPPTQFFNKNSLDPTKNITIGDSSNTSPFNKQ
jgi:flagellar basal body-associated protein FliL